MSMIYSTTFTPADKRNGARIETRIPFGADRRELRIETGKDYHQGISTRATVVQITADGMGYTHAFGLGGGGDYNRKISHEPAARATEKALRTLHNRADIAAQFALARAHYGMAAEEPQQVAA